MTNIIVLLLHKTRCYILCRITEIKTLWVGSMNIT